MDKCGKCKGNGRLRYDNPELAVAGEYICPECKGSGVIKQVVDKPPVTRCFEAINSDGIMMGRPLTDRDWNNRYENRCSECGKHFRGGLRSVICKKCYHSPMWIRRIKVFFRRVLRNGA